MAKINKKAIKNLDKARMLRFLENFPQQILDSAKIDEECDVKIPTKALFNKIVFCGMGGSAIGANIIKSYVHDECKLPVLINRDYTLPAYVDKRTLLFISSYSGNTEEALSAYRGGTKKADHVVVLTSGGKLKEIAKTDNRTCLLIPPDLPPRCALGFLTIPAIMFISKLGLISRKDKDIEETTKVLSRLRDKLLSPLALEGKNIAKRIARALYNKYAVIYGAGQHLEGVTIRWRGQLAENAKSLSSSHLLPEMNHNEIEGWSNPKRLITDIVAIMLRDKGDHPRVVRRMDISGRIIKSHGAAVIEVSSHGGSLLSRLFSLTYIGDYVSFYLAILNGVDPTQIDNITFLKKEMAKAK